MTCHKNRSQRQPGQPWDPPNSLRSKPRTEYSHVYWSRVRVISVEYCLVFSKKLSKTFWVWSLWSKKAAVITGKPVSYYGVEWTPPIIPYLNGFKSETPTSSSTLSAIKSPAILSPKSELKRLREKWIAFWAHGMWVALLPTNRWCLLGIRQPIGGYNSHGLYTSETWIRPIDDKIIRINTVFYAFMCFSKWPNVPSLPKKIPTGKQLQHCNENSNRECEICYFFPVGIGKLHTWATV